jgi:tetratricopeptide (TPR) repeat protein
MCTALKEIFQALETYNKGIKVDAKFAPSYLGKGRALLEQTPSKPEDALTNLEKAVELDPNLNETYLELASTSLELNDPAGALTWLTKLPPEMAIPPRLN